MSARPGHQTEPLSLVGLATPAGLEPATVRLEGECSIQLSYGVGETVRNTVRAGGAFP